MSDTMVRDCDSVFIKEHLADFLERYRLCCSTEGLCCDYCIMDRKNKRQVSSDLVLSLNTFAKQIHVTRFYPELYKEDMPKYMSATCFYLLVHHFAQSFHLDEHYRIYLETRSEVYHDFYEKLCDFDLTIKKPGLGSGHVDIWGHYHPVAMATERLCRIQPCMG